eukprot:scaffold147171_cov18-Prasinocladus_malaysianus.AAC.1
MIGGGLGEHSAAAISVSAVAERSQYAASDAVDVCAVLSLTAASEDRQNGITSNDETGRNPITLSAVLDKSGSMSGRKMDLVKKTTEFMTTQLSAQDMLGVIAYDAE